MLVIGAQVPLVVKMTEAKGRGVFAGAPIAEGTLIERCAVIVVPPEEVEKINETRLGNYHFQWGGTREASAIALGFGSLYNHAHAPNALYVRRFEDEVIEFVSLRDIAEGEEITVSYNGALGDDRPVWFEVK